MITPESHPNGTLCCDGPTETSLIAIYCRFPDQFKIHPPQVDWFLFEPYRYIVREFLKRGPAITNATGAFGAGNDVELMELSESTSGWAGIDQMIERVKGCAKVRAISAQARTLAEELTPDDLSPALSVCAGIASEIADSSTSWSDAAIDVGRDMEEAAKSYREIDLGISGLKARTSELIMIAARPGGGKTTLLHQIAELTSESLPGVSLVWTMEMTRAEWWAKTIQQLEGHYVAPNSKDWIDAIPKARRHYEGRRLQVNDKSAITCQDVRSKCAELRANGIEISAIFVDYLTLMSFPRKRDESLTDAIGAATKGFKAIAKEFGCPTFVASQLTRKKGSDYGLDDLRSSDSPSMDANQVWIVSVQDEQRKVLHPEKYGIILNRVKWRGGPIGEFKLTFDAASSKIYEGECEW